ncbi:MAG: isopentenyl-diphosphate Delta-isomerase [Ginsengibacter sp.]
MKNELIILVDEDDNEIGLQDKLSVHQEGLLHRAFSVFIFNSNGELLLQQRADEKYHSGGLWSNTCCSHPNSTENIMDTVSRRLHEEMGIGSDTQFKFKFIYFADFENGLKEYEMDYVFFGKSDEAPKPDPSEVQNWKHVSLDTLNEEIRYNPGNYSAWLKLCLPQVVRHYKQNINPLYENLLF